MKKKPFVLFSVSSAFYFTEVLQMILFQSFSHILNHKHKSYNKLGLWRFKCCSVIFFELLRGLLKHSSSNFGKLDTPGKVHHCSMFSPFEECGCHDSSQDHQGPSNVQIYRCQ